MTVVSGVTTPDYYFNFAQHIIDTNRQRANKIAYVDDRGALTYKQLSDQSRRFAAALQAAGVQQEQRMLLIVNDCNDLPIAFLGAIYAGVVAVPVNTLLTADDYAYMIENSRAQAIMVSGNLLPKVQQAIDSQPQKPKTLVISDPQETIPETAISFDDFISDQPPPMEPARTCADDPAFWLYTSGSTGKPKGAIHTQANPYWTAELYGKGILGITEQDICFSAAKLFFAYGLGNALTFPLSVGATVVLMAGRPTPEAVFKRWVEQKTTVFFGAPTGYAGMLASPMLPKREDVHLRLTSSAGEALPAELGHRFTDHFGVEIIDGIGSTEMLHIYISNKPGDVHYGTSGVPVPGYQVELRNNDGSPMPEGEPGDLYVKGPSAALMYAANRKKSRETFCGEWCKSGDKYIRNSDGTYTYSGRSDDMIKVSGIYVSPFEVEATLLEHSAVLETAVIGVKDHEGLTKTKAFIVLKQDQQVTQEELKAFVKERLAPYKYPRFMQFIAELPKTATGKIQRFRLRAME